MNKQEIEQRLTDLVIEQLQKGVSPWSKPWTTAGHLPTSLQTGKPYRGTNLFMLSLLGGQYSRSLWVTYLQAKHLGGHVRKGERGLPIIYYSMINKRDKETGEEYRVPLLRLTTVFNVEQCEGITIPARLWTPREPVELLEGVSTLLDKYEDKPDISHSTSDQAFYSPSGDYIRLPLMEQFTSAEEYAHTLAHELTHSTGHPKRLDRKGSADPAPFGSPVYAREELVAELGSAMALGEIGVEINFNNSATYLAGWLKALKNDPSMIIKASSDAQKAVDYMLGRKAADIEVADEVEEVVMA